MGAQRSLLLPAEHPERVAGVVFIGPAVHCLPRCRARTSGSMGSTGRAIHTEGWGKYNRHYWLSDYEDFLEFFFSQALHRAAPQPSNARTRWRWGLDYRCRRR